MNYFYVNGIPDAGTKLGIAGFDADTKSKNPGTPEFNVSGFSGWGNSGTNWFQTDHTWQASEQLSWIRRNHSIMAGIELRKLYTSRSAANSPRGVFNFNGQFTGYAPADFMLGLRAEPGHADDSISGRCGQPGAMDSLFWITGRRRESSPSITESAMSCRPCRIRWPDTRAS